MVRFDYVRQSAQGFPLSLARKVTNNQNIIFYRLKFIEMSCNSGVSSSEYSEGKFRSKKKQWFLHENITQTAVTFINQISWVFAPLQPLYDSVKFSCPVAHSSLLWMENFAFFIVSQVIEILSYIHARRELKDEVKEVIVSEQTIQAEDNFCNYTNSIIKQLYKIWFQAHQNLFICVNYIANLYEKIVPVIPGDETWDNLEKENISIRELCLYANIRVIRSLCYHLKKFLQQNCVFLDENEKLATETE